MRRLEKCGLTLALLALAAGLTNTVPGFAALPVPQQPDSRGLISLIIDDIGNRPVADERAVRLPGPVACAFLPHAPHTRRLARLAEGLGKSILLHLPMESVHGATLGPGGLTRQMTQAEFVSSIEGSLAAVSGVSGISNHMGSLLTRQHDRMGWLMETIHNHGNLYYVDSRTTHLTVAHRTAEEFGVPVISRDVFLDHDPHPGAIRRQFRRLLSIARKQGTALGVAHPHADTLAVLEEELAGLDDSHVRLVKLPELMQARHRRNPQWHAYLSPSRRGVKNWKPLPSSTCCAGPASRL